MKKPPALAATLCVIALSMIFTTMAVAVTSSQDVLSPGTYTAKVKAIVCSGCPALIKQALLKVKGIDAVSIDSAKKTVQFTVTKGSTVKLSEMQTLLKAAAKSMGMGADYELSELKAQK